jgi:hypothetical protein
VIKCLIGGKIIVYNQIVAPFAVPLIFNQTKRPVSPHHTRKGFLAKMAGFITAFGLAPRLFGKSVLPAAKNAAAPIAPFAVRTDARAVARSSEFL